MWYNMIKTTILLASLSGILMFLGGIFGGYEGVFIAFVISLIMNGFAYFFSDKMVLALYKAQRLNKETHGYIYDIIEELVHKENMPMPKLWLIHNNMANAFATGRNPKHASIAVTTGILDILEPNELRGVLAHELSHVKNRDILISSIAATIASSIGMLANMMQNIAFWSSMGSRNGKRGPNPLVLLIVALIMPIAATLIQLAISRSREYMADESGAYLSDDPLSLAAALEKLQSNVKKHHLQNNNAAQSATAHLFIIKPFSGSGISHLFSTHPPVAQRVARLEEIYENMTKVA